MPSVSTSGQASAPDTNPGSTIRSLAGPSGSGGSNSTLRSATSLRPKQKPSGLAAKPHTQPLLPEANAQDDALCVYERLRAVGMPDGVKYKDFAKLYHSGEVVESKGKERELGTRRMMLGGQISKKAG